MNSRNSRRSKFIRLLPLLISVAFAAALPFIASAAVSPNINNNVWDPAILKGPLVICTGNGVGGPQCDPHNFCELIEEIAHILYFAIGVVIWIIAPIMVAWSGISLIMSRGNPEAMKNARSRITRVAIGIIITISAYLIISIFVNVLGISGVGGFSGPLCNGTAFPVAPVSVSGGGAVAQPSTTAYTCKDGPCSSIGAGIAVKNGDYADPQMVQVLQCIKQNFSQGIEVTEAMPPSSAHQSGCHQDGCCVDMVVQNVSSCDQVSQLEDIAARCGALKVVDEYYQPVGGQICAGGAKTQDSTGNNLHVVGC